MADCREDWKKYEGSWNLESNFNVTLKWFPLNGLKLLINTHPHSCSHTSWLTQESISSVSLCFVVKTGYEVILIWLKSLMRVFATAFYFTLISCCVVKVCAKTVGAFCDVTSGELVPVTETRPLRVWSTEQRPPRTGGNTSAAVLVVVEESHPWSACLLTRCGNILQESWLYITKFKMDVMIRWQSL